MTKPANEGKAFTLEITKCCGNCDAYRPFPNKNGEGKCIRRAPAVLLVGMQQHPVTHEPIPFVQGFFPPANSAGFCYEWVQPPVGGESMPVDFATVGKTQ